jgi:hypothetical protein
MNVENHSEDPAHAIGKLCVGGDWACAHGDIEALGYISGWLEEYAREPLQCELVELADMCRSDSDSAVSTWLRLKTQVLRRKS